MNKRWITEIAYSLDIGL